MSHIVCIEVELFTDDYDEAAKAQLEMAETLFEREDVNIVTGTPPVKGVLEDSG